MNQPGTSPAATVDAEALFREFDAPLMSFVRRRVNDSHAAEDIVADVMLRIHQHLGHLDDHEKVTAWMYRIARNAISDHYRWTRRRLEQLDPAPDDRPGRDDVDEWVENQDAVLAELAALAATARRTVTRRPATGA